jgi:RNA-directed DNA polymerase
VVGLAREVKRGVSAKPLATFKQRVRQLTRRSGGFSMAQVVQGLRPYLLGWKAYFGLAQTPKVWRELDEWRRHRLRDPAQAVEARPDDVPGTARPGRQSCGGATGGGQQPPLVAQSRQAANSVLNIAWFDRLGLPRLS